jgi:hypothetical protein
MRAFWLGLLMAGCRVTGFAGPVEEERWTISNGLSRLEVRVEGEVEFNDQENDVVKLPPGGRFRMNDSRARPHRTYEVRNDGTLTREYQRDRVKAELDADGRAWLGRVIPYYLRESGRNAPARTQRILAQEGFAGLLAEMNRIESDSSRARYSEEALVRGRLSEPQMRDVLRFTRRIGSDHERASLYRRTAPALLTPGLRDLYFEGISQIGSDSERSGLLQYLISQNARAEDFPGMLRVVRTIGSDSERAGVLRRMIPRLTGWSSELRREFFRSTVELGSDAERQGVLTLILQQAPPDRDTLAAVVRAAAEIGSDSEKAVVLRQAVRHWLEDDGFRRAFFQAVSTIGSDSEKGRVLLTVVQHSPLGVASAAGVARCSRGLGSDSEKSGVLVALGRLNLRDPDLRLAFDEAMRSIGSDSERRRVEAVRPPL